MLGNWHSLPADSRQADHPLIQTKMTIKMTMQMMTTRMMMMTIMNLGHGRRRETRDPTRRRERIVLAMKWRRIHLSNFRRTDPQHTRGDLARDPNLNRPQGKRATEKIKKWAWIHYHPRSRDCRRSRRRNYSGGKKIGTHSGNHFDRIHIMECNVIRPMVKQ